MTTKIPRLEFADLESRLAETLTPRYERLGYLGEFFKCMGHQPAALRGFIDFFRGRQGRVAEEPGRGHRVDGGDQAGQRL